jgi:pteridine reductase
MSQTDQRRVALVTGAAKRVGKAVALGLADAGFDIAFTYLNSEKPAEDLAVEIRRKGRRALAIRADLTDSQVAADAILGQFTGQFSRLDVLVNNASLYSPDDLTDAGQARRFWAIHVESPLLLARKFGPLLQAAGGSIVNMVDLQGERPIPGYLAYCASKAGLWNLTLGLARELAPRVRVNGIAPGVVAWEEGLAEEKRQQYLRRVPLARAGTPDDVAKAVRFLCVDAGYVTGQILRLDGGRSIT